MKRRITVVTREIYERVILAGGQSGPVRLWCSECEAEAEVITPEVAARLTSVNTRAVYRWVEAGLIHFMETPDGRLLICRTSLAGRLAAPEPPRTASGGA